MMIDYKFGTPAPEDRKWTYGNVWASEETTDGGDRLVIAPAQGQTEILTSLLENLNGPFWVLYVLVIPRERGKPGRYQSPEPQTEAAISTFLNEFSDFLERDGRHNIWIASESGSQRLIDDRHNLIYAYGALADWRVALEAKGLHKVSAIRFPSPHSHHYHQSLDQDEDRLLNYWDWHRTDLQELDEE